MAPVNVPEGFVFVPRPRGRSIAADLLKAADETEGADRKTDVRTVTGGYHVAEAVAEKFSAGQPAEPEVEDESKTQEPGSTAAADEAAAEKAEAEAKAAREEEQGFPEGAPTGDWTVKHLEKWAESQEPKVDLGDGNKAAKLEKAVAAYKPAE